MSVQVHASAEALVRVRPFAVHWRRMVHDRRSRPAGRTAEHDDSTILCQSARPTMAMAPLSKLTQPLPSAHGCDRLGLLDHQGDQHDGQRSTSHAETHMHETNRSLCCFCTAGLPVVGRSRVVQLPQISSTASVHTLPGHMKSGQPVSETGKAPGFQLEGPMAPAKTILPQPGSPENATSNVALLKRLAELKLAADAALSGTLRLHD